MHARTDAISGGLVASLGLVLVLLAWPYEWADSGRTGPGFLPGIAGVLMLGSGLLIGVRGSRDYRRSTRPAVSAAEPPSQHALDTELSPASVDQDEKPDVSGRSRRTALVFVALVLTIYLTGWLGFIPAFALLAFGLVRFLEGAPYWKATAYAAVIAGIAWVVFSYALRIPLPQGIWSP